MKKIFSLLLSFVLCITTVSFNVFAEENESIVYIDSIEGTVGETISIPICIKNNPGIISLVTDISYDNTALKFKGVKKNNDLDFCKVFFGKEEVEPEVNDTKVISNSLGIDLGTLNTVIAKPSGDKFDLYQIPSVVAVKKDDPSEVLAVGEEAKKMLGRTPEDILAVRPLKKGVIENVVQAQALLIKAMQIGINEGASVGSIQES